MVNKSKKLSKGKVKDDDGSFLLPDESFISVSLWSSLVSKEGGEGHLKQKLKAS